MNAAITIGYDARGGARVLADPTVPVAEQKRAFKGCDFSGAEGCVKVELWLKSAGVVKTRKLGERKEPRAQTVAESVSVSASEEDKEAEKKAEAKKPFKKAAKKGK